MSRISAPDLVILRAQPIKPLKGRYLSVAPRTTVYSGQQNGAAVQDDRTNGYVEVPYDGASGTIANVMRHMSVDFGTTPGARDIGTVRVRRPPSSNQLFISETAPAQLALADNVYFTVKDEFCPRLVFPTGIETAVGTPYVNTIELRMDYEEAYSNQNANIPPKANITRSATSFFAPKPAGFVDGFFGDVTLQTYRTVTFSMLKSIPIMTGSTLPAPIWDVRDGTITVGSINSTTITVRFPVGYRVIYLFVGSGVMVYPIWVHDATHLPITRFQVSKNNTRDWREMELDLFELTTDETIIPKGTPICYWEVPDLPSIPDQYRDQFLGWASEDVSSFRRYFRRMTLTLTGMAGWFARWRGFPERVYDPLVTPASWFQMRDITLNRLVYYVVNNFTTGSVIGNLFFSPITDILKTLDITLGSPWQQMIYILSGHYGRVKADSLNGLWIGRHYSYMTDAEKALIDITLDLTRSDWLDSAPPSFSRRYYDTMGSLIAGGASFDGTTEVLYAAIAPGGTQGDAEGDLQAPGQNLPSVAAQNVLNFLTGKHFAFLNNPWSNVPMPLLYDLDVVEPAWGEPISITTVDADTGLTLNGALFLVNEVNVGYGNPREGRGKTVEFTLEGVVDGADAEFKEVPPDATVPPDSEPPPDIIVVPTQPVTVPALTGVLPQQVLAFASGSATCKLGRNLVLNVGVGTWDDKSTGLSGAATAYYSLPFAFDKGVAFNSGGVDYAAALGTGFTTWVNRRTLVNLYGVGATKTAQAHGSHLVNGWGMAIANNGNIARTVNDWQTNSTATDTLVSFWICGHEPNHLWALRFVGGGAFDVLHSTDGGISFTVVSTIVDFRVSGGASSWANIFIPYQRGFGSSGNNLDDSNLQIIIGISSQFGGSSGAGLYRVTAGQLAANPTNALTAAVLIDTTATYWSYSDTFGFTAQTWETDRGVWGSYQGVSDQYAVNTTDGGASITGPTNLGFGSSSVGDQNGFNGWPVALGIWIFYGIKGMRMSFDEGVTWWGAADWLGGNEPLSWAEFRLATVQ